MAQPRVFTPWITVAYSRLPGWANLALLRPSVVVTVMPGNIIPNINPVSLKLYILSSRILYLALVFRTSTNHSLIAFGSSQKTL
jgi:hypothetical protein